MSQYTPIIYADCGLKLPDFNWRVSISVDMFNFADTTPYKVFWQAEPEEIKNGVESKLIKNQEFYDLILAWNSTILSVCKNSKFFPSCAGIWTQESDTNQKKFAASYLISSKTSCEGHRFRHTLFDILPLSVGDVLITKYKSPPYLPNKRDLLVPFQYSIAMENARHPNYFTEKIIDCFATKTIPIYWGCPNIGDFFNRDGILTFGRWRGTEVMHPGEGGSYPGLESVLKSLTPDYYQSKQAAIEDNYQRALKYGDRTGDLIRAINNSWMPTIDKIHSGEPNVG